MSRDEFIKALQDINPNVDVDRLLTDQPNQSLAWYANHIINNGDTLPKRFNPRATVFIPYHTDDDEPREPVVDQFKLKSAMIAELTEMAQKDLAASFRNSAPRFVSNFRQLFIHLSEQCLDQILKFTGGRHVSSFIIAFFVKNGLLESLVDLIPTPIMGFWTATDLINLDKDINRGPCLKYKAIRQCLLVLDERYSPIFEYNDLSINITSASFTCLVCYDLASLDAAIACGDDQPSDDDLTLEASDPCSSTDAPQTPVQHKFCTECIQRHAEAAAESMPLSECGTGLKCMEHGCKQPLLFSRVRNVLPKKTIDLLENRVLAENLAAFGDIEKCPKCNFAVAMEAPKEVDKVFRCLRCKSSWCRLCELPWNDDHFGQTCDEAALKIGVQKKQRDLERMASEAVMRKCHRCNLVFTKDEGCNKITCRCRATQCYICRAKDIDYTHFCGHPQIPLAPRTCCQKCLLWENPKTVDENAIVQVYQKAGEEPPKDIGPQKKRPRMAIPHQ